MSYPTNLSKKDSDSVNVMSPLQSMPSVTLTSELFEKLYLNPANKVSGDLRRTFANPTPLALVGFLIASTPLGCALMGWRGAGGGGAGTIGALYFFGGMLQIIGAVLEWIIGNTFVYIVFGSFGAFWLAFAATLTPFYNAEGAFTAGATTAAEKLAGVHSFQASLAFFLLFMGLLVFMYLICSLRTNVVFFIIFLFLDLALFLLTAAYWESAEGNAEMFETLSKTAGACVFVFCVFGWYLLFVQLLSSVDFPLDLPVGDLSNRIPSNQKKRLHMEGKEDV
ncbi:Protein alcS [Cladobotryum mycophilum]|uniref:Protein alcS n=1 Tax=Cladobotryum mycophilum TaxID=491253 RepID=A0ABR0SRQ8_9HYPO